MGNLEHKVEAADELEEALENATQKARDSKEHEIALKLAFFAEELKQKRTSSPGTE